MSVPLPPPYYCLNRHSLMPELEHDDSARMNFLASMNTHIGSVLFPGVAAAFERKVEREQNILQSIQNEPLKKK